MIIAHTRILLSDTLIVIDNGSDKLPIRDNIGIQHNKLVAFSDSADFVFLVLTLDFAALGLFASIGLRHLGCCCCICKITCLTK